MREHLLDFLNIIIQRGNPLYLIFVNLKGHKTFWKYQDAIRLIDENQTKNLEGIEILEYAELKK